VSPAAATAHVSQLRVVHSEWIKFRSVRSRTIASVGAAIAAVGLGMLFASFAARRVQAGRPADSFTLSLAGFGLAQLIIGVVGVIVVTAEYSSEMIRTTFSAVTRRLPVLWAKAIVVAGTTFVVMVPAVFLAYLGGRKTYNGSLPLVAVSSPGVARALIGTAVYLAGISVLGVALGFLLRSTGLATGVLFAGLLVVPPLTTLLPNSISNLVTKLMPSNAGRSFAHLTPDKGMLTAGAGLAVFLIWIATLLAIAAVVVHRRDS
jgi:ABC-type transport system involved in multi-copper enzyme maturation permease subunit